MEDVIRWMLSRFLRIHFGKRTFSPQFYQNPAVLMASVYANATLALDHWVTFGVVRGHARLTDLLSSRSQSTELATAAQMSQSPKLKAVVEKACCSGGT